MGPEPRCCQWGLIAKATAMNRLAVVCCCLSALFLMPGCSQPAGVSAAQVRLVYQQVQDPVRELCTDDTMSITQYVNVPLVRFVGTTINLNGNAVSQEQLVTWTEHNYRNLAEQALWVQIAPGSEAEAERSLLPLVVALPKLQLRRVQFSFSCANKAETMLGQSIAYDVHRCTPKLISKPDLPKDKEVRIRKGEKPSGKSPLISFQILDSGVVTGATVKRSSGVADWDAYALAWISGMHYNARPNCGTIDNQAVVTIDF